MRRILAGLTKDATSILAFAAGFLYAWHRCCYGCWAMVDARLRVIYGDTDQMGVVYYANYFRYFEFARGEYLRAVGGNYADLEATGSFLPVIEAFCRYRSPARYDDVLIISTEIEKLGRASLTFHYQVRRANDPQLLCEGKTIHASVGKNGRPTRMPQSLARLLEQHRRAAEPALT